MLRVLLRATLSMALLSQFAHMQSAFAADEILWEVKQPFRYFKYQSDYEIHRWAFEASKNGNTEPSILDMEHLLNDPDWWNKKLPVAVTTRFHKPANTTPLELLKELRQREIQAGRSPGYLELSQRMGPAFSREYDFRRLGWASLLFPAHQEHTLEAAQRPGLLDPENVAVCWNRAEQRHNNCADYIKPKIHTVVARLKEPTPGVDCVWQIDGQSQAKFVANAGAKTFQAKCDQAVDIEINSGSKAALIVRQVGEQSNRLEIEVKDLLVVGLGDSFSSGEGNPDVPAKMKWTTSVDQDPLVEDSEDVMSSSPGSVPLRKADGDYFAAQWIDRACHRSAYSYQIRTAIQTALKDPHRAITFLGYACSGAEINEGLFNPFMGPEVSQTKARMAPFEKTQLTLLLAELCERYGGNGVRKSAIDGNEEDALIKRDAYKFLRRNSAATDTAYRCGGSTDLGKGFKRPIDLLLLSIGGNDAGFARWITAAILPPGIFDGKDRGLWKGANAHLPILDSDKSNCEKDPYSCKVMTERWRRIPSRYALLRDFLNTRLSYSSPRPILIYSYPIAARDKDGRLCQSGNSGMTVWGSKFVCLQKQLLPGGTLKYIEDFAKSKLNGRVAEFATGSNPSQSYTLVDDYTSDFENRSFCASAAHNEPVDRCQTQKDINHLSNSSQMPVYTLDAKNAAETLQIPRANSQSEWKPFDPALRFDPYRSRTRWARTMNDAYLLINQNKPATRMETQQELLGLTQSSVYGAFHPTAEAHARVATSFSQKAEGILKGQ